MCYIGAVKTSIHGRLRKEDRAILEELKKATGRSESELIGEALRRIWRDLQRGRGALDVADTSSGRFAGGPQDLSTNKKYLAEFGR